MTEPFDFLKEYERSLNREVAPGWTVRIVSLETLFAMKREDFHAIPFSAKLEIIEEMNRFGRATLEDRRARRLPYIDPYTGERVSGSSVREEPPAGSESC